MKTYKHLWIIILMFLIIINISTAVIDNFTGTPASNDAGNNLLCEGIVIVPNYNTYLYNVTKISSANNQILYLYNTSLNNGIQTQINSSTLSLYDFTNYNTILKYNTQYFLCFNSTTAANNRYIQSKATPTAGTGVNFTARIDGGIVRTDNYLHNFILIGTNEYITPITFTNPTPATDSFVENLEINISVNNNLTNNNTRIIRVYYENGSIYNISTNNSYINYTLPAGTFYFNASVNLTNGSITHTETRRIYSNVILANITLNNGAGIINNFTITINNTLILNTTTGYITTYLTNNTNYTINITAIGYGFITTTILPLNNINNYNYTLRQSATIYLRIYDELTEQLINQLLTITVTDITNPAITTTTTSTGIKNITSQPIGDILEIRFNSTNFTTNRYYRIIPENSYIDLNVYLLPISAAQNFSICWYDINGVPIYDLHVYQYFLANTTYALTQDAYTDILGRTFLTYTPTHYYLYNWSSTVYANNPFILNPPDNTNTLSSGCNYDITIPYTAVTQGYSKANVTGTATFNNATDILTFTYTSYNSSYTNYYYNITKIINSREVTICSDSSTSTTDTFTCNLFGYTGTVNVYGYADNQIFYGGYIEIDPRSSLWENLEPADSAYYTGFIILIITLAGISFGILGTLISGILGLIIATLLGILEPLTITLILADMIIVGVIAFGLRRR